MMKKNDVHALVHALCTLCTLCARSVHALVHGSAFILKYSIECTMIACLNIRWTLLAMKWLKVMLYNETKAHNALCTLCARCARCARSCALMTPWITLCKDPRPLQQLPGSRDFLPAARCRNLWRLGQGRGQIPQDYCASKRSALGKRRCHWNKASLSASFRRSTKRQCRTTHRQRPRVPRLNDFPTIKLVFPFPFLWF